AQRVAAAVPSAGAQGLERPPVPAADPELQLLQRLQEEQALYNQMAEDGLRTEIEKRPFLVSSLERQQRILQEISQLKFPSYGEITELEAALADGTITEEQLSRLREYAAIQERIAAYTNGINATAGLGPSAYSETRDRFLGVNDPTVNRGAMSFGEGLTAGPMEFVAQMGSVGEQVAGTLQGTLGATVNGITDSIYGWATGTQSFGETLQNLGATVFQQMLQTIVQMGVQWVVTQSLIKLGLISRSEERRVG